MTAHLPTTGELECDECSEIIDVDLTAFAGDPESVGFDHYDMPDGWVYEGGEHLCPDCKDKGENDEV